MNGHKPIKDRLRSASKSDQINMAGPNESTSTPSSSSSKSTCSAKKGIILPTNKDVSADQIWETLQQLVTTVNDLKLNLPASEGTVDSETLQNSFAVRLNQVEDIATKTITKVNLLGNMFIRQEEKVEALEAELKYIRRTKTRPNLVVRGIVEQLNETDEICKANVQAFFKEQMEISDDIPIKKAYRLGKQGGKADRPLMVKLAKQSDKSIIYKSVSNLKGKKNVKRRLFNIDDDMDAEQAEPKNYYRDLAKENASRDDDEKLQLKYFKGQILANNQKVKNPLLAPNAARILAMTDQEQEDIRTIKLYKGEEFTEKNSEYISYVQKAKTVKEVQKGLYKMRIKFADATHISCGYRLEHPNGPFNQDYWDDGEVGAGRAILQAIKDRSMTGVAVFVVRYYGGYRLGRRRFEITSMLSTAALATFQMKIQTRRSRTGRQLSQSSLASSISTDCSSEDEETVTLKPVSQQMVQQSVEEPVSHDEHFSTASEPTSDGTGTQAL